GGRLGAGRFLAHGGVRGAVGLGGSVDLRAFGLGGGGRDLGRALGLLESGGALLGNRPHAARRGRLGIRLGGRGRLRRIGGLRRRSGGRGRAALRRRGRRRERLVGALGGGLFEQRRRAAFGGGELARDLRAGLHFMALAGGELVENRLENLGRQVVVGV